MARILLADDDSRTRDVLKMIFQDHEYEIARDWPEVFNWLEKHKEEPFDLVVTDIVMPGYKDLIKTGVRYIFEEVGVKTIFISGYSEQKMDNLPDNMRFIKKPFSLRMFKSIAERLLKQ